MKLEVIKEKYRKGEFVEIEMLEGNKCLTIDYVGNECICEVEED